MKTLILISTIGFCALFVMGCDPGIAVRGRIFEPIDTSQESLAIVVGEEGESSTGSLKPLDGVKIELLMPTELQRLRSNPWRTESTGPDGVFVLDVICPKGNYKFKIRMTKNGYEPLEIEIDRTRDWRSTIEVILVKKRQ